MRMRSSSPPWAVCLFLLLLVHLPLWDENGAATAFQIKTRLRQIRRRGWHPAQIGGKPTPTPGSHHSIGIPQKSVRNQRRESVTIQPSATSNPDGSGIGRDGGGGGACADSNPALLAKMTLSAAVQTVLLTAVLRIGQILSKALSAKKIFSRSIAWPQFLACFAVVFGSSLLGALSDGGLSVASNQVLAPSELPGDPDWYKNLKRPPWEPPGWVFPIMWLIVSKPTQLVALTRLFAVSPAPSSLWNILTVYCAHLAAGDTWNKVFFGLQCTGRGAAAITWFYGVLLTSTYLFSTVSPAAAKFLLPTTAWVTVAAALNWNIWLNNKQEECDIFSPMN